MDCESDDDKDDEIARVKEMKTNETDLQEASEVSQEVNSRDMATHIKRNSFIAFFFVNIFRPCLL